jgi:SAM-dependent methyltransferase
MKDDYDHYANARLAGDFGEMSSWRFVQPFIDGKRTLDIGCSDGLYLKYMTKDSIGIEQVEALAKIGRERGLNVVNGDVYEVLKGFPEKQFEAVLFSHVMEHVDSPIAMLRQICRVLEDNGVLVLGLPIERNIFRDLLRMDYFDGTHIYAFSVRNARKLLEESGFSAHEVFFHLPKCRRGLGYEIESIWNSVRLPFRAYFSMAYWIIAVKR